MLSNNKAKKVYSSGFMAKEKYTPFLRWNEIRRKQSYLLRLSYVLLVKINGPLEGR